MHRAVGVVEQRERVLRIGGVERNADARGPGQLPRADVARLGEAGEESASDRLDLQRAGDVLEQHGELVSAETREQIARPYARFQPLDDGAKQAVPELMPQRIVDGLEAVQIEE